MKLNRKAIYKAIGWEPHPAQKKILSASDNWLVVVAAGVRFGKTQTAAFRCLEELIDTENPKNIWIVSPTYDLTFRTFNYVKEWFLKIFPKGSGAIESLRTKPNPYLKTAWGSVIEGKSTKNPDSLLGAELDLFILDEAARIHKEIFERYLFARLTSRKGKAFIISTPFGMNHFYELWELAKREGVSFQFRSIDNPYFPRSEWRKAKRLLPKPVFEQEYEAKFLQGTGTVFGEVENLISPDLPLREPKPGRKYIMGIDLGKQEDYTVIVVVDMFSFEVVYYDRFHGFEWGVHEERIVNAYNYWQPVKAILDIRYVGSYMLEKLRTRGLNVEGFDINAKQKNSLIAKLSSFISNRLLKIPPWQEFIEECRTFGYTLTESGNITYSAPPGKHDDTIMALALAVWGITNYEPEVDQQEQKQYNELDKVLMQEHYEPRLINSRDYI